MLSIRRCLASTAACLFVLGCSSNDPPGPSVDASTSGETPEEAGTVSCEGAPNLDTYVANLTKAGKAGLTFVLVSSDPAPPARGTNTWTLKIDDASAAGVDGAQIGINA